MIQGHDKTEYRWVSGGCTECDFLNNQSRCNNGKQKAYLR